MVQAEVGTLQGLGPTAAVSNHDDWCGTLGVGLLALAGVSLLAWRLGHARVAGRLGSRGRFWHLLGYLE